MDGTADTGATECISLVRNCTGVEDMQDAVVPRVIVPRWWSVSASASGSELKFSGMEFFYCAQSRK